MEWTALKNSTSALHGDDISWIFSNCITSWIYFNEVAATSFHQRVQYVDRICWRISKTTRPLSVVLPLIRDSGFMMKFHVIIDMSMVECVVRGTRHISWRPKDVALTILVGTTTKFTTTSIHLPRDLLPTIPDVFRGTSCMLTETSGMSNISHETGCKLTRQQCRSLSQIAWWSTASRSDFPRMKWDHCTQSGKVRN